jgi:hypothetical protein
MNMKRFSVPEMDFDNGRLLKVGQRVSVKTRHGTEGKGRITTIHFGEGPPPMMMLEMDADTVYSEVCERGWVKDEIRLKEFGAFGGEIQEILSEPVEAENKPRLH